jgi:protein gp37
MDDDWVRAVRDRCLAAGIAFFFKQRAVNGRKQRHPLLDGARWEQYPMPPP